MSLSETKTHEESELMTELETMTQAPVPPVKVGA